MQTHQKQVIEIIDVGLDAILDALEKDVDENIRDNPKVKAYKEKLDHALKDHGNDKEK